MTRIFWLIHISMYKIKFWLNRKVFSIVISQIVLTCLIVAPMILHQPTREMLIKDQGIYWASYILFFAVYMAIVCCNGITRSWPQNYLILFVMTIAMSVWVGCICARYDPKKVKEVTQPKKGLHFRFNCCINVNCW